MVKKSKIIIVDDDEEYLEELEDLLASNGYEIVAFSNGESPMAEIQKIDPDLILLDLKMPGMNGFEIVRQMYKVFQKMHISIVLMSGYYDRDILGDFLHDYHVDSCISKPTYPQEILRIIDEILTQKQ